MRSILLLVATLFVLFIVFYDYGVRLEYNLQPARMLMGEPSPMIQLHGVRAGLLMMCAAAYIAIAFVDSDSRVTRNVSLSASVVTVILAGWNWIRHETGLDMDRYALLFWSLAAFMALVALAVLFSSNKWRDSN